MSKLKSIGLIINDSSLIVNCQDSKGKLLHEVPISIIKKITLTRTAEKKYSKSKLGWMFWGGIHFQPNHAPTVYRLCVELVSGNDKFSYLSDFDLISVVAALKELNLFIENGN